MRRLLVALVTLPILVYGGDALWFHWRVGHPAAGEPFGTLTFYYATPLKNGKLEVFWDQPQSEVCVRSLFPHKGHQPCWSSRSSGVRTIE